MLNAEAYVLMYRRRDGPTQDGEETRLQREQYLQVESHLAARCACYCCCLIVRASMAMSITISMILLSGAVATALVGGRCELGRVAVAVLAEEGRADAVARSSRQLGFVLCARPPAASRRMQRRLSTPQSVGVDGACRPLRRRTARSRTGERRRATARRQRLCALPRS